MDKFNYEQKLWGASVIKLVTSYLGYLRLKYCLEDLKNVKGRVLDAGCGGGGFVKAVKYHRSDLDVYGIDISKTAIAKAKKEPQGVKFEVGNLYKLPHKDDFFDAVIIEDVFEHLEQPYEALNEINRVIKKGGIFSAFIPLEGSIFSLHFWLDKLGWKAKKKLAGHIQKFNKNDLRITIYDSHFKIEKERYGVHLLGQVVDIGFYTIMDWLGRRLAVGLEEDLKDRPILRFLKNFVTSITNLESQIFSFIPGAGIHIRARKI